ncbi:MAG: response regulator [Phormidesmis sp. CAN_BIN36]|nr:response regulator [Phormidesmis sp. CAN_BIN36]
MAMHNASLSDFLESAPICPQTATLAIAIEILGESACSHLVVVDRQQYPIGLIRACKLMSRLAAQGNAASALKKSLSEVSPSPIEPLPTLLINQTLNECCLSFKDGSQRLWAVVDRDRRFKGLVDSSYILKLIDLATRQKPEEPNWPLEVTPPTEADHLLKQQLQVQIAKLRVTARRSADLPLQPHPVLSLLSTEQSSAEIQSLMQVLERLPMPMMLQSNTGRVVAENTFWQQQFAELADPDWVQHDADAWNPSAESPIEMPLTSFCRLGSTANTCICVCPLKNGQERILHLIKIPLGTVSPDTDLNLTSGWRSPPDPLNVKLRESQQIPTDPHSTALETEIETAGVTCSLPLIEESLWLVLAQDVTEQQQIARELAAKNADLVQLNRLKDEFLACISHELRTPLTAVLGLSSLLKDQLLGTLNDRQVRYAQLIHRSGRHLMTIVNDILDLTRMETGQLEITLEPANITTVCNRAFEQAQQSRLEEAKPEVGQELPSAPPTFTLEIEPGLETLIADEMRLRQMLLNLLSNALKFTNTGGKIGLRVNLWEGWVAFTVWDTGIGIPAEKQHLIFQKFQQLENPLTRRFEGTGLGLVLTQRLARLHGGDVTFISKEHQGSQFTLLLPPNTQSTIDLPNQSVRLPPLSRSPHNRLVLVVEAVVRSIEQLSEQLSDLGYRVIIARSGTEAVEKARRLQPCVVLINPLLPTLSGWDVLTLLKADPQTRHIPVTVMATRGDREQAQRHHADGFLSVPITNQALKQTLDQMTDASTLTQAAPIGESLVILRLSPIRYGEQTQAAANATIDLNHLLHSRNHQVLEADDLEQAELLAQVWKPHVVLLDAAMPDPIAYLRHLSEQTFLASLPLVTLDQATTQAANQIHGLSVFPYLAPLVGQSFTSGKLDSALLQVIQVAAGFAWRPLVLAIDPANLAEALNGNLELSKASEWLSAMMHAVQTAGFRGTIGRSWAEVAQKLQSDSVDLILFDWHDAVPQRATLAGLSALKSLVSDPPILVLDRREAEEKSDQQAVSALLREMAAPVVVRPQSMEELLSQINQILTFHRK